MTTLTDTPSVEAMADRLGTYAERPDDQEICADALRSLAAERDILARQVRELDARGIHTCGPDCKRPMCVLVRERDGLRAKVAHLEAAEEGAKEAFGVVVQQKRNLEAERDRLRALLDAAYADIRRGAGGAPV